jgi:hypothetical protein
MTIRLMAISVFAVGIILAGGKPGGGGVTPPGTAEIRTFSETVPAGGTVQVKSMLTQPHPISSGGGSFALDGLSVDGVAVSSPSGTTVGAAVVQNGNLYLSVFSPSSDFGTNLDYPFITITMDVPGSAKAGSTKPLSFSALSFQSPSGPVTLVDPKPGTLTIGGTLSVHDVVPGGGTWPAGTVISVRGTGFQPGTKLLTKMKTSSPAYVSPTEMRFTLQDAATLDQQPISVTNPDRSTVTYFSYLRGVLVQTPSRPLLQVTEPIFPTATQGIVTIGPLLSTAPGQFTGLAVQNPNPGPVVITFQVQSTGVSTTVLLPSGGRVMDDILALTGGTVSPGDVVTVSATAGVQMVGLYGDETAGTVTPFVPSF